MDNVQKVYLESGGNITANAGTLTLRNVHALDSLNLSGSALVVAQGGNGLMTLTSGPVISGSAAFDLNDNDLIAHATSLNQIVAYLANGRIISSAASGSGGLMGLGTSDGATFHSIWGSDGTFDGQLLNDADILIKYTIRGDADLSGRITTNDFAQAQAGLLFGLAGWTAGDFNNDGVIDALDFQILNTNYLAQP